MTKKKKQDNPAKPATFHTTPFSSLKGIAVSAPSESETPKPAAPPPKPVVPDEADLFLQAMAGVTRVDRPHAAVKKTDIVTDTAPMPRQPASAGLPSSTASLEPEEQAAFAQAIGHLKLDVTFTDHVPEDEELKPLGANRLRQLKRGVICVNRQLDLHGLTREEALEALPRFLQSAMNHGEKAVLVITGKGNNSPVEPVLQQAVAGWLRDAGKKLVVEYAPAPREMGGSGAFVVFLRG